MWSFLAPVQIQLLRVLGPCLHAFETLFVGRCFFSVARVSCQAYLPVPREIVKRKRRRRVLAAAAGLSHAVPYFSLACYAVSTVSPVEPVVC